MDHDVKASEATPPQRSSETTDGPASSESSRGAGESRRTEASSSEQRPDATRSQKSGGGSNTTEAGAASGAPAKSKTKKPRKLKPNNVRKLRIDRMMSKAELARRANLSVLTIDRVEKGFGCRMNTKRKILEALGLSLEDRVRVFGEEE
jgi:DNA-binding XRE family transcriptional regulator